MFAMLAQITEDSDDQILSNIKRPEIKYENISIHPTTTQTKNYFHICIYIYIRKFNHSSHIVK